jgi:hypothetical protein
MRFKKKSRLLSECLVLCCVFFFPGIGGAQESVTDTLKRQITDMQEQLKKALDRIDQLEKEKSATSGKIDQLQSATSARLGEVEKSVQAVQSAPTALNPSIGMVLDATVEHRSTVGGNFNFRAAEFGFAANVDPFARAYSFVTGSNTGIDVEEAAAITSSLPWNLTAKGGRFFADFGRYPKVHDHELPFVNRPLSMDRVFGGESQADGAELSYLFPTSLFLRGTVGAYNKIGADNTREDNTVPRAWSHFTFLSRLSTYFDLTDNHSVEVGSSLAYTPSNRVQGITPEGIQVASAGDRVLSGIDLTYRYQPLESAVYQGFTWGSEFFSNSECVERPSGFCDRRLALGGYSYGELKLSKSWSTGFLFDYSPSIVNPGKKTIGYSPFLTWNVSEFNRLRFQFTHADDRVRENKADGGNQFFLQWTTVIGAHTHGFLGR